MRRTVKAHQWEFISYWDMQTPDEQERRNIDPWPVCARCGMLQRIDQRDFPCRPAPRKRTTGKQGKKGGRRG